MPSCGDPEAQECGDINGCEEGCVCKEGMVFDGHGGCLPIESCGCRLPIQTNVYINVSKCHGGNHIHLVVLTNFSIQVGEYFISQDCSLKCSCEAAGEDLVCVDHACPNNMECSNFMGIVQCACNDPYVMIGGTCGCECTISPPFTKHLLEY